MLLSVNVSTLLGNTKFIEKELHKRFQKVGITFVSYLRTKLNRYQDTRTYGVRKIGLNPSKPGEYPKKQSGDLLKSITFNYDKDTFTCNVGSNLQPYPKLLQTGTPTMAPRPWLSRGYNELKLKIGDIIING